MPTTRARNRQIRRLAILPLPPEIEEQIIAPLSSDAKTLAQCALVSRQWLHLSRKQLFATRTVTMNVERTQDTLYELFEEDLRVRKRSRKKVPLSFGPYIRDIRISRDIFGAILGTRRNATNRLMQLVLPKCPNLRILRLENLIWDDISLASLDMVHSLSRLTVVVLDGVRLSPDGLIDFLERLPDSVETCEMRIDELSDIQSLSSKNLPLRINTKIRLQAAVQNHYGFRSKPQSNMQDFLLSTSGLNVVGLAFFGLDTTHDRIEKHARLIQHHRSTLVHLHVPLGDFYMMVFGDRYVENPVSLAGLTNLQHLDVGILALVSPYPAFNRSPQGPEDFERSSRWLTSLLQSLPSPNHAFKVLSFKLFPIAENRGAQKSLPSFHVPRFNWAAVEDELLNVERFTSVPLVKISFLYLPKQNENSKVVTAGMEDMRRCMRRVADAGRLQMSSESSSSLLNPNDIE